jgi:hypothetical protein
VLLCGLTFLLAGCAASTNNSIIDSVPSSIGGLPANTPERPAEAVAYPAVHDMPPPRTNTTLSAEEQVRLEHELTAVRARQDVMTGVAPAKQKQQAPAAPPPRITPAVSSNNSIY